MDPVDDDLVDVPPGWALVLYTEGLVEDRSRSLDHGFGALAATLADATGSAEHICDRLMAELVESRQQDDDVALLVLVRREAPEALPPG